MMDCFFKCAVSYVCQYIACSDFNNQAGGIEYIIIFKILLMEFIISVTLS